MKYLFILIFVLISCASPEVSTLKSSRLPPDIPSAIDETESSKPKVNALKFNRLPPEISSVIDEAESSNKDYCIVIFSVTEKGISKNHEVVKCSNNKFLEASLNAAKKFQYKPKVINGEAVEVEGVLNVISFELENKN